MAWRLAKSLEKLRSQVNAMAPQRAKHSDGTIGDAAHASRSSDHNPHVRDGKMGVVTALDITHDPRHGVDAGKIAETLRRSRDPRIKYVISNARIFSSKQQPWVWRPYGGANAHTKHVHISVMAEKALYDSTKPWTLPGPAATEEEAEVETEEEVEETETEEAEGEPEPVATITPPPPSAPPHGAEGVEIEVIQRRLIARGYHEVGDIDGKWGGKTAAAIAAFKNDRHIAGAAVIDAALKAELAKAEAEGWTRPIAPARAEATEAVVEAKAPELVPVKQGRLAAFWAAISTAFLAAVNFVADQFKEVLGWLAHAKDYLNVIPGWVWLLGIAGGLVYFYFQSKKGAEGIVKAVRTGERN